MSSTTTQARPETASAPDESPASSSVLASSPVLAIQRAPSGLQNSYSAEAIERGLLALVWNGGVPNKASRSLAEAGLSIPPTTLKHWRDQSHAARYQELREREVPAIHGRLAAELEDTAREALAGTRAALELAQGDMGAALEAQGQQDTETQAKHLKLANDAGTLARNLGVVGGVATQHVRPMRDMPSAVIEHRTADQALKRLRAIAATVESDAVLLTDEEGGAGVDGESEG